MRHERRHRSIRDDNGLSVEDWGKIEMNEGVVDVLALLRGCSRCYGGTHARPEKS